MPFSRVPSSRMIGASCTTRRHSFPGLLLATVVGTILLSVGGNGANAATVSVDRTCYVLQQDTITINFADIQGEGVWIGLYPQESITDLNNLPAFDSGALTTWILPCGRRDTCEDVGSPSSGSVQMATTDIFEPKSFVIVVSGDRAALSAQAVTEAFQVVSDGAACTNASPTSAPISNASPTSAPISGTDGGNAQQPQDTISNVVVVSDDVISVVNDAKGQLANLIIADPDLIGKSLRLMFHDCVGGCDGCVDMSSPDNAGLLKPIQAFQSVVDTFALRGLTRTDIWVLAALAAAEVARPPPHVDIAFPLHFIGRRTCEMSIPLGGCGVDFFGNPTVCDMTHGRHVELPHGTIGTQSINDFFVREFNFTPQQITAIMGAHSVGRMSRENSGHSGTWDLSPTTLDNGYFLDLAGSPPQFVLQDVFNDDLSGIPNTQQWLGVVSPESSVFMLNADVALVHNVPDMGNGIPCNPVNSCSQDTPFISHVQQYVFDAGQFLRDFRDVLDVLSNHGHIKAGDCPDGRICTFGFNPIL